MKLIRVLTIGHSYVVKQNRSIVREVARDDNFEVTVIAPEFFKGSLRDVHLEPEPNDSNLKVIGVRTYLSQSIHGFFYDPVKLTKIIKEIQPDLVHAWEEPYIVAGFQVAETCHQLGVPYFFRTAQSIVKNYPPPFRWFEKRSWSHAKRWIAGGHLVFRASVEKGLAQDKGRVITLAVDSREMRPFNEEDKNKVASQLNLRRPIVTYLGRLSEEKGLDVIMSALESLGLEREWSFLALGSGDYKEKIESWALEKGMTDRVKVMLLPHDEVKGVLPASEVLVVPSQTRPNWKEQFGRMIVEGFAAGVPVIGSDSGEIPYVIGEAGIICSETSSDEWAKALERLLWNRGLKEKLIGLGLKRVEKYTAISVAEDYKAFYRDLKSEL